MRTPVFELHIAPMFRATDQAHMRVQVDLQDYERVKDNAERILGHLREQDGRPLMPPRATGGPWPEEWIAVFERWMTTGFRRLELGTAQYAFDATLNTLTATGTFPAAGHNGWLQIESDTPAVRTYVFYVEAPEGMAAAMLQPFTIEEPFDGEETTAIDVRDATGVHRVRPA